MVKTRRAFLTALWGTAVLLPTCKVPTPGNVYDHLKGCWSWYEAKEILSALPARRSGLVSRKEDDFTVVSDPLRGDLIRLNPAASGIWALCDGRTGVETMVLKMTDEYSVSPGSCRNDVVLTLRTLRRMDLIAC